ncbi:ISL3 family transposase [Streptomyces sp. YIM S03343]
MLSWATLLNCVMRVPDPPLPRLSVLAVDDFAMRRSRRYGTLVVDAESRLPVDVWDTRDAEPLATWLRAHAGIEAVCRDGSQTYRAAISAGAPEAIQVSDRFHLWQGLGRKVYEVVAAHRGCLPEPGPDATAAAVPGGLTAARTRRLRAAVHRLLDEGMALRAIARHLDLDRNAVRRYARAATWQQVAPTWPKTHRGQVSANLQKAFSVTEAPLHRNLTVEAAAARDSGGSCGVRFGVVRLCGIWCSGCLVPTVIHGSAQYDRPTRLIAGSVQPAGSVAMEHHKRVSPDARRRGT